MLKVNGVLNYTTERQHVVVLERVSRELYSRIAGL